MTNETLNEVGDWTAQQVFSAADLRLSPEEYAAHKAHLWGCFSLDRYHYHDPILGAWVRRLGEILSTKGELEKCRRKFLTPEELLSVQSEEAEPF